MKTAKPSIFEGLTDEQIVKEFISHFKVQGAMIVYLDNGQQWGHARWKNTEARQWVNGVAEKLQLKRMPKIKKIVVENEK